MNLDRFVAIYPCLFHMAESGSWPSIREHGLLSTKALLDLFEITGPRRYRIESCWRPESVPIRHSNFVKATIRDQGPMPPVALRKYLDDYEVEDWYRLLNSKTFFWPTEDRLLRFLNAKAYRDRSHMVLTIDTAGLVEGHLENITLSSINSGSLIRGHRRSPGTFRSINDFPASRQVAEVAVGYLVPNIEAVVTSVAERRSDGMLRTIWLP